MTLYCTYSRILITRNYQKYIQVILTIAVTYLIITFATVYIDSVLSYSTQMENSNLRYIFISILTIFYIAGVTLISYQYYDIMKSGMRDYYILMGLGATKHMIRFLIFIHVALLIFISIPAGLFCGYIFIELMKNFITNISTNESILKNINSTAILMMIAGVIGSLVISIGVYLERNVWKMPLSNILSGSTMIGKEG